MREYEQEVQRKREPQAYSALSSEPDIELDLTELRSKPERKARGGRLTNLAPRRPPQVDVFCICFDEHQLFLLPKNFPFTIQN